MVDLKTIKERYLFWAVLILGALVIIFVFFSKYAKNVWLWIAIAGVIIYFLLPKKRLRDIYEIARIIQLKHYKVTGELLDISNIEATEAPLNSGRVLIGFKNNARVFEYNNNVILGTQIKEMSTIINNMEKSRIVEQVAKTQTVKEQIKQGAEKLGFDVSSLGLE